MNRTHVILDINGYFPPSGASIPSAMCPTVKVVARSLIECVPNFSEGRDAAKVEAIAAAIRASGSRDLPERQARNVRSWVVQIGMVRQIRERSLEFQPCALGHPKILAQSHR